MERADVLEERGGRALRRHLLKNLRAKGDVRRQGEGGYPKNLKFGETSFMDGPL